jgi:hypothetical protein
MDGSNSRARPPHRTPHSTRTPLAQVGVSALSFSLPLLDAKRELDEVGTTFEESGEAEMKPEFATLFQLIYGQWTQA